MIDLDENRMEFKYRMLGRLQQDCEYYLSNGGRDANHALYYHDEVRHIVFKTMYILPSLCY